jgi:hypothetical protein
MCRPQVSFAKQKPRIARGFTLIVLIRVHLHQSAVSWYENFPSDHNRRFAMTHSLFNSGDFGNFGNSPTLLLLFPP